MYCLVRIRGIPKLTTYRRKSWRIYQTGKVFERTSLTMDSADSLDTLFSLFVTMAWSRYQRKGLE